MEGGWTKTDRRSPLRGETLVIRDVLGIIKPPDQSQWHKMRNGAITGRNESAAKDVEPADEDKEVK